ncbi:hypothetical protein DZK25_12415 [Wenzhouxiangella sp. 15181]|nr:hypothetical protein DZK25_12415 [Wenzhouxiangella sp. 15181]RFP70387.1 hypothetical protein DZK26_00030 [Wenzhouxiangella sp. 15190]
MCREPFEDETFLHPDLRTFNAIAIFIAAMQQFHIELQLSADMFINRTDVNIVLEDAEAWSLQRSLYCV